jgi:diguanylate cyclase (GGDEF)-like protein
VALETAVTFSMGAFGPLDAAHERHSTPSTEATRLEIRPSAASPTAITRPEMAAVHDVAWPSPTATTRPEMPAVRVEDPRASFPDLSPYMEEDEETTDVGRFTDFGAPPVLPKSRDRAVLVRMDSTQAGQVRSLEDGPCAIGRHHDNDVSIRDSGLSRHHARISRDADGHFIEDVGSRNGTYVQGRRITRHRLRDGDWVQLGPRVTFRYSVTDEQQEELLRQLFELSTRDALTGAYNRQYLEERLRTEIAYAIRHETSMSLVIFDVDHFKQVNDTYGHQAGDRVLSSVALALSSRLRAEDVFARYGGEEFVVLLRGTDLANAARVAERMRAAVEKLRVSMGNATLNVSISAGCASLACCREPTGAELVGVADRRLYAAKHTGRNRVVATD